MIYSSIISHIPMFLAMSLNTMMDAIGFICVGLGVEMALLKVIAVIKVQVVEMLGLLPISHDLKNSAF